MDSFTDEQAMDLWRRCWEQVASAPSGPELDAAVTAIIRDTVRAEVAKALAWLPIETAPKDGTIIDVWRDGTRDTVYWGFPPHECGEAGQYCDSDWHSLKKPGWICSTFGEFVGGKHNPFTHWQPYPDGPRALQEPTNATE